MNKRELSILRQAAAILEKEEKKYSDRKGPYNKKNVFVYLVRDADNGLSSLLHYAKMHPILIDPFWSAELAEHVSKEEFPAEISYGWQTKLQENGTWDLCIFDHSLSDIEGSPVYEGYQDHKEIDEDLQELRNRGLKIE